MQTFSNLFHSKESFGIEFYEISPYEN